MSSETVPVGRGEHVFVNQRALRRREDATVYRRVIVSVVSRYRNKTISPKTHLSDEEKL